MSFHSSSLGLEGAIYVYNYFTGSGQLVDAGSAYRDTVNDASYYIVAPIGRSGIAFLGDAGKFVSLGKKRISQLADNGHVQATINFARGETSATMFGYSPSPPAVTASQGTVGPVVYDTSSHIFKFSVSPAANGSATIGVGRANR
jgi:hypothetical protein